MLESKAIIFREKNRVETGSVKIDSENLEGNELLLETQVSLISTGTEMRLLSIGFKGASYPFVPGYSAVCKVLKKGIDVVGYEEGDLVFAAGGGNIAEGAESLWGGHCLYQRIGVDRICKLSGNLSAEEYAFSKVASISLHGVNISQIETSDKVVVQGLGLIGQFTVRCLLARGAEVIAIDTNSERLETAGKLGAITLNPSNCDAAEEVYGIWPDGADAVFEVTAKAKLIPTAILMLRTRGWESKLDKFPKLILQANYTEDIIIGNRALYEKEIIVYSARDTQPGDLDTAVRLICNGIMPVKDLYKNTESPDNASDAYRRLIEHPESYYTMIFDWRN